MNAVIVEHLKKEFFTPLPPRGPFFKKIKDILFPTYQSLLAVKDISFNVGLGGRVAFIGPNGAGKSTTIKILTGIMHPTSGNVQVLNQIPSQDRKKLAYKIGAVFGQRSQLWFHLPVYQTLQLLAAIYDIPNDEYQKRLKSLSDKFDIVPLLHKPVRQLSLGERMRCEVVASFLHKPSVLFLDEPTIGLDVTAKAIIRDLIRQESEQEGTTLLLTSHDTDDIEKVCDRVIVIDKGQILLDDTLNNLKTRYIRKKVLTIATEEESILWNVEGTQVLEQIPHQLKIEVDISKHAIESLVSHLLEQYTIKDLTIEGPPLETIIKMLYQKGVERFDK